MKENTSADWPAKFHVLIGLVSLAILLGGFGTWATFAQISGAVVASGQIEVERNRQVIQHPDGGVIEAITVNEGDVVRAGDLLLSLDPSQLESELAVIEGQLFEVLARRARLEAERDGRTVLEFHSLLHEVNSEQVRDLMAGQERLFMARRETQLRAEEQLIRQRAQIESRLSGIEARREAVNTQAELINAEMIDQQSLLDRGLTQASRVLALQREAASIAGTQGELVSQAAQASERMTEIDIQVLGLTSTRQEEAIGQLRDLQSTELELRERRRIVLRKLERLDIRSPVSGVVYGLQVFAPLAVVEAAAPLLFIVPQDRPLVIAAQIALNDIDQIYLSQIVSLRLTAFDQRRTPELLGTVHLISADSFQNENLGTSYYRAEIHLNPGELERMPPDVRLIPGMPVEAFVQTRNRTPIEFLTQPLTDYWAKVFRES